MKRANDIEPLTVPLWPDAGRLLGFGKEKTYREARKGTIKTLPIPGAQRVPLAWIRKVTGAD